ncbi:hypothetical protein L0663_16590 [Dyadobacter sp. CY107]|uniref:hypothetical protein n=1 Tax=Dyadobacter fanqingshengii TaxID=2906443 RepID=UPI001F31F7D1|nr:hypothetical protein [Dyadobacter fanqingshengii]MCF2505016.1 hypothetical protein [Dyadobacter fanqingshengii]
MMALIKMILLLILITMMDFHGIIYRGVEQKKDAGYQGRTTDINPLLLHGGKLSGSWRFVQFRSNGAPPVRDRELVKITGGMDQVLMSFFPDSTFTRVYHTGAYDFGRYSYDENERSLLLTANRKTEELRVVVQTSPSGKQRLMVEFLPGKSLSLAQYGEPMQKFREDPFSIQNNAWRIRPDTVETKDQIFARLINYIGHNASILRAAYTREQDFISWEFSKGIIKVYNVGIGIVPKNEVPQAWIDSFHSRDDAMQCYALFENYLRNGKHTKHNSGNWVKDDYQILADIREGLLRWQKTGVRE